MSNANNTIRFLAHKVTNGTLSARVHYSIGNTYIRDAGGETQPTVTVYAKDYSSDLGSIFGDEYQNDTDTMTDYFEKGLARLTESHPLYKAAMDRAKANDAKDEARMAKRALRAAS